MSSDNLKCVQWVLKQLPEFCKILAEMVRRIKAKDGKYFDNHMGGFQSKFNNFIITVNSKNGELFDIGTSAKDLDMEPWASEGGRTISHCRNKLQFKSDDWLSLSTSSEWAIRNQRCQDLFNNGYVEFSHHNRSDECGYNQHIYLVNLEDMESYVGCGSEVDISKNRDIEELVESIFGKPT